MAGIVKDDVSGARGAMSAPGVTAAADADELAAGGRRVRWRPTAKWVGGRVRVQGEGFPARRRVRIRFSRSKYVDRTNRRGSFSKQITVPPVRTGRYMLRIRSGAVLARIPFTVLPDPLVVAAGDIACDPADVRFNNSGGTRSTCHMRATSDVVLNAQPAAVLALGDTQYEDGTLAKFNASYGPTWGRFKNITHPTVGNHEYATPGAAGYFDYFNGVGRRTGRAGPRNKGYYSFDIGSWHVISLNANCHLPQVECSSPSPQARWLRADLRRTRKTCVLAFAARPRFTSIREGTYVPLVTLFKILHNYRVELLLSGDAHNYERFAPQDPSGRLDQRLGVRQFVVGTGGKNLSGFTGPVAPNSEAQQASSFGVLGLRLHPGSYAWQFLPEAGGTYADAGTGDCR